MDSQGDDVGNSGAARGETVCGATTQMQQSLLGDEALCPICLKSVQQKDTAVVPSCRHSYCVYCIVRWAEEKDAALCPVCKQRFETLCTWRRLDGSVRDSEAEESVCLLKKTVWYLRRVKGLASGTYLPKVEWDDEPWDDEYFCSNEIDDTEDYYFSNAAGSARIVLTNRRFGKTGYIRSGRIFAHSTQPDVASKAAGTTETEPKRAERQKTNTKGKKALRRQKKKQEEANRLRS